jgi:hypothetical protein
MKDLKTPQELNEASENLNISDVISRLLSLQRVDIYPLDNGEFIEKHEQIEEDGMYIISEDLDKLISELKRSL